MSSLPKPYFERVHFALNQREYADRLVKKWHYTHRVPGVVQCVGTWHLDGGLFGDRGEAVAAIYFVLPPTQWAAPVWELARLIRSDDHALPPLTGLISATVRWIASHKLMNLLISYADAEYGHHGGIYQAASWNYNGLRAPQTGGLIIGGSYIPNRTVSGLWGTKSPKLLAERGIAAEQHYDQGKYLYWKALSRDGEKKAAALGLQKLAYPKPQAPQ